MNISLFQEDEPLRFERIVLYPYPDMKRVWARLWRTAKQDQNPNIELVVLNPDGTENNSVCLLAESEERIEKTLHMHDPIPGAIYRVIAEMTLGFENTPEVIDHQEFDMVLEFRDPEKDEPGFGMGVDWESMSRNN